MADDDNGITPEFENSSNTQPTQENDKPQEVIDIDNVPDMIKETQPIPQPRPHGMGEEDVDREKFTNQWNREFEKHKQPDAFDKIDQKTSLREQFQSKSQERE